MAALDRHDALAAIPRNISRPRHEAIVSWLALHALCALCTLLTLEGGIDMMPTNVPDATEAQRNLLRSEAFPADEISERLRESG